MDKKENSKIIKEQQLKIDKLKQCLREAKETKELLETILSMMPEHVYWMNRDRVYLGCNDKQAKELGLNSRQEIIGKRSENLLWNLDPQILAELERIDREVIETGCTKTSEEPTILNDGRKALFFSSKTPIRNRKKKIIGMIGISVDITERKKAERALQNALLRAEASNKAKTEFLENMRHDIRTPVVSIMGFADVIKDLSKDKTIKEYAGHLAESGQALLDFLNEVLETVQVASGEVPLLKKKFDLKSKLMSVIQLNQVTAKAKGLELSFDFDKKIPRYLIGDPKRVYRIVLELVTNAINFTEKGSVKVSVKLARSCDYERVIEITVKDTGIGIPEDKQKEIYVRFRRLTPSYEGIYKGVGVGLSIAKQFIDDLSGEIHLESQPNKGTTFRCLIPFKEPLLDDASGVDLSEEVIPKPVSTRKRIASKTSKQELAKEADPTKSRVLLVEDSEPVGLIEKTMLEGLACQVDWAKNGEQAVKMFEQNSYDLVLMDIGLPDFDGYEATKRMRALEWNRKKIVPIIALSAHTEQDKKQQCMDGGMNAVLTKPLVASKAEYTLNAFIPSRMPTGSAEVYADNQIVDGELVSPVPSSKDASENIDEKGLLVIQEKIFDVAGTAKHIGLKPEMILKMIKMFMTSLDEDLPALVDAYEKKDWKSVGDLAHKLKGASVYCGAMRVKEASSRLEKYLASGKTNLVDALYQQLLKEVDAMKKEAKEKEAA